MLLGVEEFKFLIKRSTPNSSSKGTELNELVEARIVLASLPRKSSIFFTCLVLNRRGLDLGLDHLKNRHP